MENKKLFKFETVTIVAIGLGAALFTLLFMFVKIPSPIPGTSFQTAYGISAFFGALFGPIAGALVAFIGHAISDAVQYGSPWWSWVISSGLSGFLVGFAFKFTGAREGDFGLKGALIFNLIQIIGNAVSWIFAAPVLDIAIYAEPANLVFTQGAVAFGMNVVSAGVIGTVLLVVYAAARPKKGSLTKTEET